MSVPANCKVYVLACMQKALMESKICLLNAGPTGTEILKNLVLPGCGTVFIVDSRMVTTHDCENNFFVTKDHIGQSLAKATSELLTEMNPDVSGGYRVADPAALLIAEPEYFHQFSLIIATQLPEDQLQILAKLLEAKHIPLVVARSYGLLGYVRTYAFEHRIVESKPDSFVVDLRIHEPFPELRKYADAIDLSSATQMAHKHIPYVVLLIKAMDTWKASHDSALPKTIADKAQFRTLIDSFRLYEEEDNFDEAIRNYTQALGTSAVTPDLQDVLEAEAATSLSSSSPAFWFVVAAIRDFYRTHGFLPLAGELPDMTATTDLYVELQRIYQHHAALDVLAVTARVHDLQAKAGAPTDHTPAEVIALMCKNAQHLRVMRSHSLLGELSLDALTKEALVEELGSLASGPQSPVLWYIMLRAVERFRSEFSRYPGGSETMLEGDAANLFRLAQALVRDISSDPDHACLITLEHAQEMTRYGAGELHAIAALVGGVGSQEAVKLVTAQFTPMDNTFIFNGITSVASTLKL